MPSFLPDHSLLDSNFVCSEDDGCLAPVGSSSEPVRCRQSAQSGPRPHVASSRLTFALSLSLSVGLGRRWLTVQRFTDHADSPLARRPAHTRRDRSQEARRERLTNSLSMDVNLCGRLHWERGSSDVSRRSSVGLPRTHDAERSRSRSHPALHLDAIRSSIRKFLHCFLTSRGSRSKHPSPARIQLLPAGTGGMKGIRIAWQVVN
jgi:hypothetical protein